AGRTGLLVPGSRNRKRNTRACPGLGQAAVDVINRAILASQSQPARPNVSRRWAANCAFACQISTTELAIPRRQRMRSKVSLSNGHQRAGLANALSQGVRPQAIMASSPAA